MSEVEFKKFAICDICGTETLCREVGEDDQCGGCYWAPIHKAEHESQLAALREELAIALAKHERAELALSGSMKALTRVDNMWKKRWLEKTGEPAIALVVDDEFKAMFEEIKSYRQRLADAERRNAVMAEGLLKIIEMNRQHAEDQYGNPDKAESWACITVARAALNPKPEVASHDE